MLTPGAGEFNSSDHNRRRSEVSHIPQIPQIIINKDIDIVNSQDTIHSKGSIGSAHGLMQLLRAVDARRNERARKESQPMSFLGTILPSHYVFRLETRHYRQKLAVYNFLHRPRGWRAYLYHIFVFIMVFACLILTVFSTIKEFAHMAWKGLVSLEKFMIVWFAGEFVIRLWASSCKPKYVGWKGKFRFLRSPFRLIDMSVIILSIVVLWVDPRDGHEVFAASAFRGFHRFFQVLQMIRLERQFRPWRILASVVYDQREQLIITAYIGFLALCFVAFLSYLVEKDYNENFDNIADALWWAVVTLCTVGYGDRVPVTWLGKLIASVFTILGVSIFALPAGIIGTGLALRVSEEHRIHQKKTKKVPAAVLIQNTWRWYACTRGTNSIATWHKHRRIYSYFTEREKNAIRFIRIVKFFIAKRHFKIRLRPVDVKDVLERYERGHSDVLGRIKNLQLGLNSVLGTHLTDHDSRDALISESNECSLSQSSIVQSSLVPRIITVEEMIKDIETKLDQQNEHIQRMSNDRSVTLTLANLLQLIITQNSDIDINHADNVVSVDENSEIRRKSQ